MLCKLHRHIKNARLILLCKEVLVSVSKAFVGSLGVWGMGFYVIFGVCNIECEIHSQIGLNTAYIATACCYLPIAARWNKQMPVPEFKVQNSRACWALPTPVPPNPTLACRLLYIVCTPFCRLCIQSSVLVGMQVPFGGCVHAVWWMSIRHSICAGCTLCSSGIYCV